MIEPLRRFFRRVAAGLGSAYESAAPAASDAGLRAHPLVRITHAVQDVQAAVEQQLDATRRVDDRLSEIETQVSRAWRDRESLTQDYYATLRGVLQVLDDCRALPAESPGVPAVRTGLERILREQGVEPIPLAAGDRFDAATQCCEQTEDSGTVPAGMVLRVLEAGYCRRLADGGAVTVRPARVVVSQAGQTKESRV